MMEALWVQQWHNRVDQALLKRMLRSSEPWARAAATRVLCYWRDRVPDAMALLNAQVADPHPAVRLEAVRAASFFRTPDAIRIPKAVEKDLQDRFLAYTYQQTMTTLEGLTRRDSTTPANAPAEANTTATALPELSAAAMRRDLRDKGVQTVTIGALPEQMLFDVRWFVVEAGKPVQLTLNNADFMPHNVIIGQPGSISAIGNAAAAMPAPTAANARAYVPDLPVVIEASRLVQRGESDTIKFTAPAKPGEYTFVCTFPGHWVRMYGVMLVVENLEAWEARPTVPIDPTTGKPFTTQRVGGGT
jgi:azurin